MEHTELIERYLKGPEALADAVRGLPPAILDKVAVPGKWTIREYMAHIVDADLVGAARIRAVIAEPGGKLMGFDQERWTAALPYNKLPVEDVLETFRAIRKLNVIVLRAIGAETWHNKGTHPRRGEFTLAGLLELSVGHCENHVRTIRELRERLSVKA